MSKKREKKSQISKKRQKCSKKREKTAKNIKKTKIIFKKPGKFIKIIEEKLKFRKTGKKPTKI